MRASSYLFLLPLIGWCSGILEVNLEYQYHYSGRVATGIPDMKDQYSASGIQFDATFQVPNPTTVLVQFSNIEVGDFHDELHCDVREPLPIEYHPLLEGAEFLQTTFSLFVNESTIVDLNVPEEPLWVTNIRKAVINIFRITIVEGKIVYGLYEDVIPGHCWNWYSLGRLPEQLAAHEDIDLENRIEEDVQRESQGARYTSSKGPGSSKTTKTTGRKTPRKGHSSKTSKTSGAAALSVPNIEDTLWTMSRVIDFARCKDVVSLQHLGDHDHTTIDELIERSSIGVYLLRGDIPNQRIERAVMEGTVTVLTSKDSEQHITTFTNQTVQLRAVRTLQRELQIESELRIVHNWHFETDHCITSPGGVAESHHTEEILTGIHMSDGDHRHAKDVVIQSMNHLADFTPFSPSGDIVLVEEMKKIIDVVALLSSADLQELYDQYLSESTDEDPRNYKAMRINKRSVFLQAVGAVGTETALRFLTSKAQELESVFANPASLQIVNDMDIVLKNPSSFVTLMEFVKAIPWTHRTQTMKSFALMNLAKLAHSRCLTSQNIDVCSEEDTCSRELVINTLIPYLQQGLEDEESALWKRLVYLQALSNLGTPHTISILKPIILGISTENLSFRMNAIWSLRSPIMQHTARHTVFEILMPVFENYAEPPEIRSIAFLAMSTQNPLEAWWHFMAASTWRDPSSQVANFISSTMSAIAHSDIPLSKPLGRLLYKAKPAVVASLSYSLTLFLNEFLYSAETNQHFSLAWLSNGKSIFPEQVFASVKTQLLFGFTGNMEVMLHQSFPQEMIRGAFKRYFGYAVSSGEEGSDHEIVREMWNEVKENLGLDLTTRKPTEIAVWYKIESILHGIMFGKDTAAGVGALFPRDIRENGVKPSLQVYIDSTIAVPTELGLPLIAEFSASTVTLAMAFPKEHEGASNTQRSSLAVFSDVSDRASVHTKTLVPWSPRFSVGSGIDRMSRASIPVYVHYNLDIHHSKFKLSLEPTFDGQVTVAQSKNLPYTYLSGPFPTASSVDQNDCKELYRYNPDRYAKKTEWSEMGLSVTSFWVADFDLPSSFTDHYRWASLSLSHAAWEYHCIVDMEASTTKSIGLTFTYVSTDKSARVTKVEDYDDFSQYGQSQGGDYGDFVQYGQSASQNYQDIIEVETNFGDSQSVSGFGQEQETDSRQRIAKIQQEVSDRGHIRSVAVEVDLVGTPTKSYEAVVTWATGIDASKTSMKLQLALIRHVPQGLLGEPHSTCFDVTIKKPKFLPLMTAEELLSTDLSAHVTAELYDGITCSESNTPELEIEGTLSLTAEAEADLRKKLFDDCGSTEYLPIDAITEIIYDNVHVNAKWTEDYPQFLKNLTYYISDVVRCSIYDTTSFDHTAINPDHTLELDATKCLDTNHWTVRTTMPHETAVTHDLETPMLMHVFGTPSTPRDRVMYDIVNNHQHTACIVSGDHVRTYDGQVFSYEPNECWQNFHVDCSGQTNVAVMVRYTEHWEVRVMWMSHGLLFDMTNTEFLVNGEEAPEHDDRYKLIHYSDSQLLIFHEYQGIRVYEDRVEILQHPLTRSTSCGMCGNFDGEKTSDMVGPKGCVYTDSELYRDSWTVPGDGCGTFAFRGKKRKVEEYQEVCFNISVIATGILHQEGLDDCLDWEYQTKAVGLYTCTAQEPTMVCKPECTAPDSYVIPVKYDCQLFGTSSSHYQHTYPTTVSTYCIPK